MAPPALIEQVRRSLPGDLGSSTKFALIERSIARALDAGITPDKIVGVFSTTGSVLDSATLDSLTDSARSITQQATSGSQADATKRISAALQARAAGTVQVPADQPSPGFSNADLIAQSVSKYFPAFSAQGGAAGEQVPGSALYIAYSQKLGGLLSPAEVAAAVEDGSISLDDIISAVTPKAPGAGAQAPVERFSHEVIGGKVYRFGDMGSAPVDTGLTAPGFSSVDVDDRGNLTGIDAQGNFQVIQPGYGFAKIDPAKSFAEQQRQFDATFGQRTAEEAGLTARSAADREAANQRALLGAQTAGFQTVAGLAPQLANVAQNQAQFQRDVISSPADFLYRAFSTRGQTSPLPRVTQADFINGLSDEIAKYNQVLQSFQPSPVGFQQPQTAPQAAPGFTAPQAAPQPRSTLGATYNYQTGQWEQGGAPINVLDAQNNLTNPEALPPTAGFQASGGSVGPAGGVSPLSRPGTPSFVTGGQSPVAQPAPQAPTAGFAQQPFQYPSFQIPQIPTLAPTTQSELRSLEQQNRPPAIQSILSGQMPKPLDLGFSLPTQMQYNALTPDERKAFGTTLATQYDVTPEDYETAITQRFATPQTRRARVVGF